MQMIQFSYTIYLNLAKKNITGLMVINMLENAIFKTTFTHSRLDNLFAREDRDASERAFLSCPTLSYLPITSRLP